MREIVVSDTNIFIDLFNVGLLDSFCKLPYSIHTTDFVDMEIRTDAMRQEMERLYTGGSIVKVSFSPEELNGIAAMQSRNLSFTDCSVLYYARNGKFLLLTGDRKLRSAALEIGLDVVGIIGIIDELLSCGIIGRENYAGSLKRLMETNPGVPKKEIMARLEKAGLP